MIKLVTFDFWNTIFDNSGGLERNSYRRDNILSQIAKHERTISTEEFETALKASWQYFNGIWKGEQRTPAVSETVSFFWDYLGLPEDPEALDFLVDCFAESILKHPPKLVEGVEQVISELSRDYRLAIVSDTGFSPGYVLRKLLKHNNLLHYFHSFSFSDETGVSKPHHKAFHTVLSELGIEPTNALHIGDIEDTDIVGAKALGMKAIRFSGDPTAELSKKKPKETQADAEITHWNHFHEAFAKIVRE